MSRKLRDDGMLALPNVATRVFDTPLLIEQRKANAILRVLSGRMGFAMMEEDGDDERPAPLPPSVHAAAMAGFRAERAREGHYVAGDVAIIPVIGTLVQRGGYVGYSGMTSYDAIERMFTSALRDPAVGAILLEIDSPGGEVGGVFDLATRIYGAREQKPITAVASEFAASAAYLLGSAAGELVVPTSGFVGSVGVVTAHVDYSARLQEDGIAVTFIYAGEKKVDGNPYEPLGDRAKADLQADIDRLYGMFVGAVSKYRGMKAQQVRATEAGMYMGDQAVQAQLATRTGTFAAEFDRLMSTAAKRQSGRSRLTLNPQETRMSDPKTEASAEQLAQARADGVAEGKTLGAKAERERIKAIVSHEDAKGREAFAQHLAFETDMDGAAAVALMSKSPKANGSGQLAALMQGVATPGITQGAADADAAASGGARVLNASSVFAKRKASAQGTAR